MREHRLIREVFIPHDTTFTFDIETLAFQNLMVTWSNPDDSAAAPTNLLLFPTNGKRQTLVQGNFAGLPAAPAPGFNAYISIGPDMTIATSLPEMITVGATVPAGSTLCVRIEGDYVDNLLTNPNPVERPRA